MKIFDVQLKRILRVVVIVVVVIAIQIRTCVCYSSMNVLKWVVGKGQHVSEITVMFMNEE